MSEKIIDKNFSQNFFKNFQINFGSKYFLAGCCAAIFFLSILLRSMIDIGADTGVYLSFGAKIAHGKKYYYDFFESNFPISFYFYALQYRLSLLLHLSPIILSEIIINSLALAAIFFSAKILKGSTIYQNKSHYNLILVSFFCGFFLRPHALYIGEFGTKTSLLLIALYPYISYSFVREAAFSKKDLIWRGCLMGLIPCLKPHYLVFILFIESHRFLQKKSLRFFLELDKLVMCLVGTLYLFLMLKFTPEFFEFMVPMWQKTYSAYDSFNIFLNNFWQNIAARIAVFAFIFLIFSRLKVTANDKILTLFFVAASVLILLENIRTIDQIAVFYSVVTTCFFKFLFDLFSSKKLSPFDHQFIFCCLIFLPIFDLEILPASIFGLGGFVNIWWLIMPSYPFLFFKQLTPNQRVNFFSPKKVIVFIAIYSALLMTAILVLKNLGAWCYIVFNLSCLFSVLFFFEKNFFSRFSTKFSAFFVFVVMTATSCLLYSYIASIVTVVRQDNTKTSPGKLYDFVAYYSKNYAAKKDDGILMVSNLNAHLYPLINYLEKDDNYKRSNVASIHADKAKSGSSSMFFSKDKEMIFALSYLFDDVKNQLKNQRVKVIFFNNSEEVLRKENKCLIGSLEYYFLDPLFKKLFLENFHFENHVVVTQKIVPLKKLRFITGEKPDIFDQAKPTTKKIFYDFEVYVRNES